MTIKKHRLPPIEVFERYDPIVRSNLIRNYHRKLADRHRWYVRSLTDYFYCDGDMPDLPAVEIFDCDWTPEQWSTRPYRYFYNPLQGVWYTSYAREGLPPLSEYDYGMSREDSLILRGGDPFFVRFYQYGRMSVSWRPSSRGSPLSVMFNGVYTRAFKNINSQGVFTHCNPVNRPDTNVIIPVIREITKDKYHNVYKDVSEEIIERFGVPSNLI